MPAPRPDRRDEDGNGPDRRENRFREATVCTRHSRWRSCFARHPWSPKSTRPSKISPTPIPATVPRPAPGQPATQIIARAGHHTTASATLRLSPVRPVPQLGPGRNAWCMGLYYPALVIETPGQRRQFANESLRRGARRLLRVGSGRGGAHEFPWTGGRRTFRAVISFITVSRSRLLVRERRGTRPHSLPLGHRVVSAEVVASRTLLRSGWRPRC